MFRRLPLYVVGAVVMISVAACNSESSAPTAVAPRATRVASASTGSSENGSSIADGRIELACNVAITYTFSQQNGTVGSTSSYQRAFTVRPGAAFHEDLSTVTRAKEFDASVARDTTGIVVTMRYFNDVSVFNAIDLGGTLTLDNNLESRTTTGDNAFSTSIPGASGHHTTRYTLTCAKA